MILKVGSGGAITRLRDVGRIELGAQGYGQAFTLDGYPAAGLAIFQSPDANTLAVAISVSAVLADLQRRFPVGVSASVPFGSTVFVRASAREVYTTLVEAAVLVLPVIVLFLQDRRAMLVPATTVPVTIIGAFAAMAAFGFSINLSTLFAIALAVGIVVDDAIVVVERAAFHLAGGMNRVEAAATALDELFAPIVGITVVLMAVFIPAFFLPGLWGRLYAQLALVIAATAAISAVNAVTLKPVQCAMWLRPPRVGHKPALVFRLFNRGTPPFNGRMSVRQRARYGTPGPLQPWGLSWSLPASSVSRAYRRASCRSRTRAIYGWRCNCRPAPRSVEPNRR